MQGIKLLSVVFSMIIFAGITASSNAFAESDDQNTLDAITNIEFRSVTDFHTYLPDSQISFNVSCNQLAGEFAIGFNTIIQKSDGSPADVNDVRNLVFLQRGSSNLGAIIDAVNTGPDTLELTTVVSCAKLLPVSLPTISHSLTSTEKTAVCHNDKITLYLPSQAVGAHENHGDTLGKCSENTVPQSNPTSTTYPVTFSLPTSTGKTIICHNDKIILYLPSQAVGAHENHGDYLGDCSVNTVPPSNPASTTSNVSFSYPTSTARSTEKTAVCHNDKVTLHLPSQAVRAHLENHSDILGECSENTSTSQEKSKQQAKKLQLEADNAKADRLAKQEADKAQREADRLAKQQAKKLQLEADNAKADRLAKQEADKAQREADRLAKQQAKKLQLEADKAKADRLAKQEADKAQKEADRLAKQEADKAQKESILEAKNNQNNSKKDNKESKLPTPGPK